MFLPVLPNPHHWNFTSQTKNCKKKEKKSFPFSSQASSFFAYLFSNCEIAQFEDVMPLFIDWLLISKTVTLLMKMLACNEMIKVTGPCKTPALNSIQFRC